MLTLFCLLMFATFILFCLGMAITKAWSQYHCGSLSETYKRAVRKAWNSNEQT